MAQGNPAGTRQRQSPLGCHLAQTSRQTIPRPVVRHHQRRGLRQTASHGTRNRGPVTDSEWRKPSTYSTDRGCVEVRYSRTWVEIRADQDRDNIDILNHGEWREFVAAVKNGEYDYYQGEQ